MINIINFIRYYYQLDNFIISKRENYYIIKQNNKIFYLYKVVDLDRVIKQYLITKDFNNFYRFVLNKDSILFSDYNNDTYVLLEDNFKNTDISDTYFLNKKIRLNWRDLWIVKSNYIEEYYLSIKGKYFLIDESIYYYLGLLELGIYYLYDYKDYYDNACVQYIDFDINNLSNPLFVKEDVKERNFGEYLKYLFFNGYDILKVKDLIRENKDNYNYNLVIARLLYPNYYFNLIFDYNDASSDELFNVISRNREYELYVKEIIGCILEFSSIKKIDWF